MSWFQHVGTLTLAQDTELRSLDAESSKKKGWKFELVTTSVNGQRKINRFKVSDPKMDDFP